MNSTVQSRQWPGYICVLVACFLLATIAGWTAFATQIDNYAYDQMFRLFPPQPWQPQSILLAIDEASLSAMGGMRKLRGTLAEALELITPAKPKVTAIDLILADAGDPIEDARLETAMRGTQNLVLDCELVDGRWEDPLPKFRRWAAGLGHVHPDQISSDGVSRQIPLEQSVGRDRRWALSLEAFRLAQRKPQILESPQDLQAGDNMIPAARPTRMLRIRYLSAGIPAVSVKELKERPERAAQFKDKVVFVGITALSGSRDRLLTPFREYLPGVEIHAHAFETMTRKVFLQGASNVSVLGFCLLLTAAAGLTFAYLTGWLAYGFGAGLVLLAHLVPLALFRSNLVFPTFAPVATAWLCVAAAASYQHFVVRRRLGRSESERKRYQQAIHFVTHEMKTPLTAIQGSSELLGRYNLNDDKRQQFALMINSESKRLARMIQTFLDVERLSDGEMELKREPFTAREVLDSCLERIKPLAERKQIVVHSFYGAGLDTDSETVVIGDRELMEYALYNLLTNAVKYSPAGTEVNVGSSLVGDKLHLSVEDQGIGMDVKELRSIFQKFYRTKRAEASGEQGTGIGLSIVDQIVTHHGGKVEVTSTPGRGSCFTIVLPVELGVRSNGKLPVTPRGN